ncbi:MAG: hypothetical protein Q8R92_03845 [Deltaproteobacteria bacterium]|nr:hypothetical protein [Deltaproteobacteria bacterium]
MSNDHRIRNSVIAGLIVAAAVAIAKLFSGVFPVIIAAIGSALAGIFRHLTSSVDVPRGIVYIASLAGGVWAIRRMRRAHKAAAAVAKPAQPDWPEYTQDRFLGVVWRWQYDRDGLPVYLAAFCPFCDMQLRSSEYPGFRFPADLCCDRCDKRWSGKKSWEATQIYVTLEVQRNLRSLAWRHRLTP